MGASTDMSLSSALEILQENNKSSPIIMSALERRFEGATQHLRAGKQLQDPANGAGAAEQAAGAYNSGAWKALNMLNKMILEANEKMDFEVVRCDGEERTNLAQLKSIREDIVMFNAMAAGAAT